MKKFLSVLLSFIIVFSFSACSFVQPEKELTEIDCTSLGDIVMIGLDSNEKYTAIYYSDFVPESCCEGDGEAEYAEDDENTEDVLTGEDVESNDKIEQPNYHLSLFKTKSNKLVKTITVEKANQEYPYYNVCLDDEGVKLTNQGVGEIISYDYKLENPVASTYKFEEGWEKGEKIDAIDTRYFNCYDNFATSSSFGENMELMFYDEQDSFYMLKNDVYREFRQCYGHKALIIDNSANVSDKLDSILKVYDFENFKEINNITIPNQFDFNNIQIANFNDKYITFSTCKEEGMVDKVFVWNYNLNAKNISFEDGYCEKVQISEIDKKIEDVCKRVKENYDIALDCAPTAEFIKDSYNYENNEKPIRVYETALNLEHYLSLLPKEVYKEALCQDVESIPNDFDELRIYLVGDFVDDNIDAFASNIMTDETDESMILYIVYSVSGMSQKTFFHELMHTFEYRIWSFVPYFDDKWEKLNPKGFDYPDDYAELYYDEAHEAWQGYFARDYGMKSMLEDRATCFEELCDGMLNDNCWWKEKPKLYAKIKYLSMVLQKSFPSLKNNEIINIA